MSGTTIIIGATGGVGSSLARQVAGATKLHLIARDEAKLAALGAEVDATSAQADVLNQSELEAAIQAVEGPVSGLIFAVGSITLKPVAKASAQDFLQAFHLNALAAAQAVQAALPAMKQAEQGASVVLFSTVAVQTGFANHAVVSAAKGAVEGLTKALAAELAGANIRVNAIAPSLSDTGMAQPLLSNAKMAEALGKAHPLGRIGTAEDSAALADFLLSPQSAWMTGQIIGVDGGRSAIAGRG